MKTREEYENTYGKFDRHEFAKFDIPVNHEVNYIDGYDAQQVDDYLDVLEEESKRNICWHKVSDNDLPEEKTLVYVSGKYLEGLFALVNKKWYTKEEFENEDYEDCDGYRLDAMDVWCEKPIPPKEIIVNSDSLFEDCPRLHNSSEFSISNIKISKIKIPKSEQLKEIPSIDFSDVKTVEDIGCPHVEPLLKIENFGK